MSTLALVGCGGIGGSLALALRRRGLVGRVVGQDRDPDVAARALALGLIDAVASPDGAEVVVLAVPVRAIPDCARALGAGPAVVTDVGSTKAEVVRACEAALGGRFVGGHPLAGSERAGPDAASPDLFVGRKVILTPTAGTDPAATARVAALWRGVGAQVLEMEPERHDRVMAAVSHLPHVVAYALVGALAALGVESFRGFAGGGFTDTTRIASTPAPIWVDVFLENRGPVLEALGAFEDRLRELRRAIEAGDAAAIARQIEEARAARTRILE